MKQLKTLFLLSILSLTSMVLAQNETCVETQGYNMLLIGNSFFKPYALHLDTVAVDAGFTDHSAHVVIRGGENGQPISFWNDSLTSEHLEIKAALDQGGIEIFGMTSGHDPENPTDRIEGHRSWINYALQNNPDVTVFIAIPPFDFPVAWDSLAAVHGYDTIRDMYQYFVDDLVNGTMIEQLRTEFPSTNIFSIPTGWAAKDLADMQLDNELLDNITLFGSKSTSIFTDTKGHQGQIVIETGTLLWMSSIYNVDLSINTFDTGFNNDLHGIAKQIRDNHDSNYNKCTSEVASINDATFSEANYFPNPVHNTVSILGTDENQSYQILNNTGELMLEGNGNALDVSGLSSGLYFLITEGTERVKFMKE